MAFETGQVRRQSLWNRHPVPCRRTGPSANTFHANRHPSRARLSDSVHPQHLRPFKHVIDAVQGQRASDSLSVCRDGDSSSTCSTRSLGRWADVAPSLGETQNLADLLPSSPHLRRGFMIVLQHTFASQPSGAARVLSLLPISQLEDVLFTLCAQLYMSYQGPRISMSSCCSHQDVLVQHPDWKAQLREFVARQPPNSVAPHVRQVLE